MRSLKLTCLALLIMLLPTLGYGYRSQYRCWWKKCVKPYPNLCFEGKVTANVYCKQYSYAKKGKWGRGCWTKKNVCRAKGRFTGSTQQQGEVYSKYSRGPKGTEFSLCPIVVKGNGCTICITFEGPCDVKRYYCGAYFRCTGIARITSNKGESVPTEIRVRVSGHIKEHRGRYRVHGKVHGCVRVNTETGGKYGGRKYQFVKVSFSGGGKRAYEPCECKGGDEPPQIKCPPDVEICGDDDSSSDETGVPHVYDEYDAHPVVTESDSVEQVSDCQEIITRTWTVTNCFGQSASCTQRITVTYDNEAPQLIDCPDDITVQCDEVPPPADVTATDDCDDNIEVDFSETRVGDDCGYTLIRTWTATDSCGNTATCSQEIQVEDTTPPALAGIPASTLVECDAVPDPANVTATDNCDGELEVEFEETREDGDCEGNYTLVRTWTAIDSCGNSNSATQTITVQDTTPPVITCPPDDLTEETDTFFTGTATATDNCDDDVEITFEDEIDDISGVITRTWTATDDCGNSTTCEQIVRGAIFAFWRESLDPTFGVATHKSTAEGACGSCRDRLEALAGPVLAMSTDS